MANRGSFDSFGDGFNSYHSGAPPSGPGKSRDSATEFTRLCQVIGSNIQKITGNVAQMQRMVNQIGTQQDSAQLRDKLHQVQHYSNQLAKDTNRFIKDLSHLNPPGSQSEQRQRKMQKERLLSEFTASLNNFQAAQRQAAEKEKASVTRARTNSGLNWDPFRDDPKKEDMLVDSSSVTVGFVPDTSALLSSSQQQNQLVMEQDVDMDLLQEREQAIRQLESDISDVNQIFTDMAMLVHEQGEVIDSIETNVEKASVHVDEGRDQLSKAREYQNKARKKKCICLILVLIILAIIGIIIGVTVSKNN